MIGPADTSVLDKLIGFTSRFDLTNDLDFAADEIIADLKSRVSDGFATNGSVMDTKAKERTGRYSKQYAPIRGRYGASLTPRDLFLTGDMINNFGIVKKSKNYVAIGFDSDREAQKAVFNEDYMEVKVFDFSESERQKAINIIENRIERKILSI